MNEPVEWILASASPRRRELLARLRTGFRCVVPQVEEWEPADADPVEQVMHNARRKADAVAALHPQALVIAADTTVALGRRLFAKPADRAEAVAMLRALAGRSHTVVTGVVLRHGPRSRAFHETSEVVFQPLDEDRIAAYLERVHVLDKAGAYAVQECRDLIIERFDGSLENIIGLPVQRLRQELVQFGWSDLPPLEN